MSSDDEDYPKWNKRRRFPLDKDPFFGDIDRMLREMEKMMEEEFKDFTAKVPKDYVKERKLPDGSTVKEFGPFVYGYSMKIGPDGKAVLSYEAKPIIRAKKYEELPSFPAVAVGQFGKGRVVLSGTTLGLDRLPREFENAPEGSMLRYFLNAVMWAAGQDKWEPFDIEEDD